MRPGHWPANPRTCLPSQAIAAATFRSDASVSDHVLRALDHGDAGRGDQVLLGSELLPPSKGNGNLRAQAPAPAATGEATTPLVSKSRDAQAGAPGAGAPGVSGRDTPASSPGDRRRSGDPRADERPSPQATTSVLAQKTESRTRSDADIGGLPLPARDLLLVAFGLVGLVAVAVATSRAATPSPPSAA